jgi:U3 small nucleolar RNA-associated protein 16
MVTTRQGTGTDPSAASTPRSSMRKTRGKRELEALEVKDTPTTTKRRRKSVGAIESPTKEAEVTSSVAPKEDEEPGVKVTTTTIVHIPVRAKEMESSPAQEDQPRSARRGHPMVVIPKRSSATSTTAPSSTKHADEEVPSTSQELEFHTPGTNMPGSVYATPAEFINEQASPTPKPSKKGTPTPAASKLPDEIPSSTWESEGAPIATQDSVLTPTPAIKNKQIRFDSEEPADAPAPVKTSVPAQTEPPRIVEVQPEEDDASDSDEAPEMLTTATAVSKAKATAAETSRAHHAQEEKEAERKKQRALRITQEQAEKRQRSEAKAKKLAKRQAREERTRQTSTSPPAQAPLAVDMHNLPALLPDSILEAAGDQRPPTPPPMRSGKTVEEARKEKLNRQIKFLDQSEKGVRDVKRGSINVSVLGKQNPLLAPKFNKATKNIREHWLKGRQQVKHNQAKGGKAGKKGKPESLRKVERRTVGGGFLRGGDD